jgi:hypothetical protein
VLDLAAGGGAGAGGSGPAGRDRFVGLAPAPLAPLQPLGFWRPEDQICVASDGLDEH